MIKILSIAGSDPSSGAGLQIDLKTFHVLGVFGMAIPTALTVQNSEGVARVVSVSSRMLAGQIEAVVPDIQPDAVKTGMLFTKENVRVAASLMAKYRIRKLVVDPVIRSTSGRALLAANAVPVLKKYLFPQALILTPNIPEAEVLAGMRIKSGRDMDFAAGRLLDTGVSYVLIKGGHSTGPARDTLYGGKTVMTFSTGRQKGEFHGTGCVLSSALAVFIGQGYTVEKAVEKAKQFVDTMLKTSRPVGKSKSRYFQFTKCKFEPGESRLEG